MYVEERDRIANSVTDDDVTADEQRILEAGSVAGIAFPSWAVAAALTQDESAIEESCAAMARRLHFVERGSERIEGTELRVLAVKIEQHLEPNIRTAGTRSLDALSAREREVLALVADGLSNAAIAARLRLSDHTVKRHIANILLKLDLPTRAAAAALVGRQT